MLLLDSEPDKPEGGAVEEINPFTTRHFEESIDYEKKTIEKNRGRSYRNSPIYYYNQEKSIDK